ncbi:deoxynucleotidyltransferase terminal-interacting protein 2-like isoform X2 [Anneissia japonica]|nr:deoxynucleotidyltransferase terminal-interacting protein 2-like isoform X2 [Anneissia japonica]
MKEMEFDGGELTKLVLLAKKKIKENTVGRLENVAADKPGTHRGVECDETVQFVIDTTPDQSYCNKNIEETNEDNTSTPIQTSPILQFSESKPAEQIELASGLDSGVASDGLYIRFAEESDNAIPRQPQKHEKVMEKSVITSDFEKRHSIPSYQESKRQLKKQRKKEKESNSGGGWFNMKAAEMTDELRRDLKLIQMRSMLDSKRFYKNNDMKNLPKFVQMGQVVDSHADFYSHRIPKKQRKKTVVDELLADANLRR